MVKNLPVMQFAQSCPTLCNPMDRSPPGSSVHGILQARILEWDAISFSRGSSRPRDRTQVSCIAGRCFNCWATREAPCTYYPGGSDGKESACNAEDPGWIPGLGRSPVGGDGNPLQYSCLENSMEKELGRLQSMGSQRVGHDRATNTFTFLSFLGHEIKYVN